VFIANDWKKNFHPENENAAFWKWRHFLSSRVLVSDDCKQSITVWFFTTKILLTLFLSLVVGKLSYSDKLCMHTFMGKDLVQNPSFPVILTKGGSWALLRKSAVESTTLAQPFCINQAVGDLPLHFHFMGEYSKLDGVKIMGTGGKINAIWWNIKINVQKLADICGYELPTNLQNFTQKVLTEVKIFQIVLGGYFFRNTLYILPFLQFFIQNKFVRSQVVGF